MAFELWPPPGAITNSAASGVIPKTNASGDLITSNVSDSGTVVTVTAPIVSTGSVTTTWTVVASAAASVSPTVADTGKYYRLSHANPTFNLPTASLVVGQTEFWVTFTGSDAPLGTVDAGAGKTVDFQKLDSGTWSGLASQTFTSILTFHLIHFKYVATNTWTSDALTQV